MKKVFQWMLVAALICGASVFTACTNDDNPVNPADNLAENIIGKWLAADKDGQPLESDGKAVYTFASATKAYISASVHAHPVVGSFWGVQFEADVAISGNKMTVTTTVNEHLTIVDVFNVTAIDGSQFKADLNSSVIIDGSVTTCIDRVVRFTKVNRDYSKAVLGLWECKGLKGGETFNDANARLEFYEDGTYNYWRKNEAGEWESVTTTREFQEYFVDGTLLATRWKNVDEDEVREWWEIKSIKGDKMQWKALRQNEDRTTFEQIMDWERVEE